MKEIVKQKSTLNVIGSTRLSDGIREDLDFYQTPSYATKTLIENFDLKSDTVWEPMAGNGAISKEIAKRGYLHVYSSDIVQRDFPLNKVQDYFSKNWRDNLWYDMIAYEKNQFAIVTNPPYKIANEFLKFTLEEVCPSTCCVFLPVRYLEGQKRYDEIFYHYKPAKVLMYVKRLGCYTCKDLEKGIVNERGIGSAVAYMWLCFDRETWSEWDTKTELDWIN